MNACKVMNAWMTAASLLTGLANIGCSEGDGTQSISGASEPLFLFKDPAAAGPRLDVYEIDGRAAVSVGGPIGTEARLAGLGGSETLGELYRVIHPDITETPNELVALNERVMSERAEVDGSPRPAVAAPRIEKGSNEFVAAACKNFLPNYILLNCNWEPNANFLKVVGIDLNDRVYVWNPNPRTATLTHKLVSGATFASATIPEYWWTYATITRNGPNMYATLTPAGGVSGELGMTHHDYRIVLP